MRIQGKDESGSAEKKNGGREERREGGREGSGERASKQK